MRELIEEARADVGDPSLDRTHDARDLIRRLADALERSEGEAERLRQREADLVADVNLFGCAMLDLVRSGGLPATAAARFAELVLKFEGDLNEGNQEAKRD